VGRLNSFVDQNLLTVYLRSNRYIVKVIDFLLRWLRNVEKAFPWESYILVQGR